MCLRRCVVFEGAATHKARQWFHAMHSQRDVSGAVINLSGINQLIAVIGSIQ